MYYLGRPLKPVAVRKHPKSRSGKGQSGGLGPAGAFFVKNAG